MTIQRRLVLLLVLAASLQQLPPAHAVLDPAHQQQRQQQQQGQQQQQPSAGRFLAERGIYIIQINAQSAVEALLNGGQTLSSSGGRSARFSALSAASVERHVAGIRSQVQATVAAALGSADKIVAHYGVVVAGAAVGPLTLMEVASLKKNPNVVSVEPSRMQRAATISTPRFLELDVAGGAWAQAGGVDAAGEDVVIGVVDTGFWPELPAFSDRKDLSVGSGEFAYGPAPAHFKGSCQPGIDPVETPCNRKVIGCRFYTAGWGNVSNILELLPNETISCRTTWDFHGIHTGSTAAGNAGTGCSSDLLASSKMTGIAPRARLVFYKALWGYTGNEADIISALEDAVRDGVDVINYSAAANAFFNSLVSPIATAFKNIVAAGIFVAAAGGNTGGAGDAENISPWLTTVAMASHDRRDSFDRDVRLGNGETHTGAGLSTGSFGPAELVLASAVALPGANESTAKLCADGMLDPDKAHGKIIACDRDATGDLQQSKEVFRAGGVGMLLLDSLDFWWRLGPAARWVPTIVLNPAATDAVRAYAGTTGATATLVGLVALDLTNPAPVIDERSGRGPAMVDFYSRALQVIKPDIAAPGVNIWASVLPGGLTRDDRPPAATCGLLSGTSMATPHIAGIAALVRSRHPGWSPAAVKSAMMTTAYNSLKTGAGAGVDSIGSPFDTGAGHINATAALSPGLVFDAGVADYNRFLCGNQALPNGTVAADFCADCALDSAACDPANLNLPSIAVLDLMAAKTVLRTVTSVADQAVTWSVSGQGSPEGYTVQVTPGSFSLAPGESRVLSITISHQQPSYTATRFGFIAWTSSNGLSARIPVAVKSVYFVSPSEVTLSSRPANHSWQVATGWSGKFTTFPIGLDAPRVLTGTVKQDPYGGVLLDPAKTTEAGSAVALKITLAGSAQWSHLRIAMFDEDLPGNNTDKTDLDLWLFKGSSLVGISWSRFATEQIDLRNYHAEDAGDYTLYVYAVNMSLPSVDFKVYVWNLRVPAAASTRMQSTPHSGRPAQTMGGKQPVTLTFNQRRLSRGSRYLGAVLYGRDGASQPGFNNVDFAATTLVYLA